MLPWCLLLAAVVGCGKENSGTGSTEIPGASITRGLNGQPRTVRFADGNPTAGDIAAIKGMTTLQEIHAEAPGINDAEFELLAKMPALTVVCMTKSNATSAAIAALAASETIYHLDLSGAVKLKDEDLSGLSGNKHLRVLTLSDIPLTDKVADVLASLENLEELSLDGTKITAATIRSLAERNPELKALSIGSSEIGEDVIASIALLTQLETLAITNSMINGESFGSLKSLPKLRGIKLTGCANVTNQAILAFAEFGALSNLNVSGTQFTAKGLNESGFGKLNLLEANDTQVTDEAIPYFKGLPSLYSVTLRGTSVTEEGVRKHFATNHQTAFAIN